MELTVDLLIVADVPESAASVGWDFQGVLVMTPNGHIALMPVLD